MAGKIDIINMALSRLQLAAIQSLDDPRNEARVAKLQWDIIRDAVLRDHPWGFASRRTPLALLAEKPSGFENAYALPVDCLAVRSLLSSDGLEMSSPYRVGNLSGKPSLWTNLAGAWLEYTARIEDTEVYDPIFTDSLAWRLGAVTALAIKGEAGLFQAGMQGYQASLQQATARDAREFEIPGDCPISSFESARL